MISSVVSIFGCSEGCFPKLTSCAKCHFEISCCVVQAPSKGSVLANEVDMGKLPSENPKLRLQKILSTQMMHKDRPNASDAYLFE